MFCRQCGQPLVDTDAFCTHCGAHIANTPVTPPTSATPASTKDTSRKTRIAVFASIAAVVLIGVLAVVLFSVNTNRIRSELEDTTWYSEPTEFVAVDGSKYSKQAKVIELCEDGTAIIYTYVGSDIYEVDDDALSVVKTEEVDWSIDLFRTFHLGNHSYSFSEWEIDDGCLKLGGLYYDDDEWGYSK